MAHDRGDQSREDLAAELEELFVAMNIVQEIRLNRDAKQYETGSGRCDVRKVKYEVRGHLSWLARVFSWLTGVFSWLDGVMKCEM